MDLDLAPHPPGMVFEAAPGRGKGVAESDEHVLVPLVSLVVAVDDDLPAGDGQIDADRPQPALAVVAVGLGDHDVAAGDPVVEPLEFGDVLQGGVADGLVDRHVVEGDLWLGLHGSLSAEVGQP